MLLLVYSCVLCNIKKTVEFAVAVSVYIAAVTGLLYYIAVYTLYTCFYITLLPHHIINNMAFIYLKKHRLLTQLCGDIVKGVIPFWKLRAAGSNPGAAFLE